MMGKVGLIRFYVVVCWLNGMCGDVCVGCFVVLIFSGIV